MPTLQHEISNRWTGNLGIGTASVKGYSRDHTVSLANKPDLHLTTGNPHVGDPSKLNPEDLLVSAISSCHMLTYLYLCSLEGIVITDYEDRAIGFHWEDQNGSGKFNRIILKPAFRVNDPTQVKRALELHHEAHEKCFIANSLNFPVLIEPDFEKK